MGDDIFDIGRPDTGDVFGGVGLVTPQNGHTVFVDGRFEGAAGPEENCAVYENYDRGDNWCGVQHLW